MFQAIMWTTLHNPPSPPNELSARGNILMQAVTKNWMETNNFCRTFRSQENDKHFVHNSLERKPYEHQETLTMLQSKQPKLTDLDRSNVYLNSNTNFNEER